MEKENKKSLKWLWISLAIVIIASVVAWWLYNVISSANAGAEYTKIYKISAFLAGVFFVTVLGYLLGRITIKGVSLGTAGVFLVAIMFGFLCTLIPEKTAIIGVFHLDESSQVLKYYNSALQNIGLVLFVGSVGFIAGPKFFRDFKKNIKTYIPMGILIILSGALVAVLFALIPAIGPEYSAGLLSGALTSTPGYSSALEAATSDGLVTMGQAIAYPFGVIGVVLFVQLMPKFLKADMCHERGFLKTDAIADKQHVKKERLLTCDDFGLLPLGLAIVLGLLVGAIKIPLTGAGFNGACFSLGTTGGVLVICLIFGHFGRIGKLSLEVPTHSAKVLRELGLMLFLIGAGVDGGVKLVTQIDQAGGGIIVVYGLIAGAVMTIVPMIVGFFFGGKVLKLPLLNNLGSITGGMTSTPALGTLINTAETEDVASAYASTYPIALVLIVLACNLMIGLL